MKKFVTTRGLILTSKSPQWNSPVSSDVSIKDVRLFASSEAKEEISENDSGIEVCDSNEESAILKLKSSVNSTSSVTECSDYISKDCNNNFGIPMQNIKNVNGNLELSQTTEGPNASISHQYVFPSLNQLSMNSNLLSKEYFGKVISESCISNFKPNPDLPYVDFKHRKFMKKHETTLYNMQNKIHLSCDIANSSPSLTCNSNVGNETKFETLVESAPILCERSKSESKSSLSSIPYLISDANYYKRFTNIYEKSKRHKKCSSHLTLQKKLLQNPNLTRKWYSSESLSKQIRSKLPDIVEEHAKVTLTSAAISVVQNKYLGAETLAETLQDIFILTSLLKRFANCEPPDKILNLEEFKAKRIICKRAIRNFMINVKNAILNYESLSFVDSCRLSCCLSYADVVACSCLLIDYLSMSSDRNILAAKVSSVGSNFCRVAILANSSFGKHSSEKSSKVFFQSTDRLIQNLNDLTVHVKDLRQNSVSRKF